MINFIKDIGQLITGGIGIVDDELVFKDSEGNVKTTGGEFETVSEIPESLDPGQIVFVGGLSNKLWVGAGNGYFPSQDVGTPCPLDGGRELICSIVQVGTNDPVIDNIRRNEMGTITPSRHNTGAYNIGFSDVDYKLGDIAVLGGVGQPDRILTYSATSVSNTLRIMTLAASFSDVGESLEADTVIEQPVPLYVKVFVD